MEPTLRKVPTQMGPVLIKCFECPGVIENFLRTFFDHPHDEELRSKKILEAHIDDYSNHSVLAG